MVNNRTDYTVAALVAIIIAMTPLAANACDPPFKVELDCSYDPEWCDLDCFFSVGADASYGEVWNYWYWNDEEGSPSYKFAECYWTDYNWPCGGPEGATAYFSTVGEATIGVHVDDVNEYTHQVDQSAEDEVTVYVIDVEPPTKNGCVAVGGPRVQINLPLDTGGTPTQDCELRVSVAGSDPDIAIYQSATGGDPLVSGAGFCDLPVTTSSVWVEGTGPTNACEVWLQYIDPYGRYHPKGCDPPKLEVKVYQVALSKVTAGNQPDLPAGRICVNAQSEYKKAKYQVTVQPEGAAKVEVASGSSVTDLAFQGIGGSNVNALTDAQYFWVVGDDQVGNYEIKLTHNSCSNATDTNGEKVFRFKLDRDDEPSELDGETATYGGYEGWAYALGQQPVTHSEKLEDSHNRDVFVYTDPATSYEGNVKVSARAETLGTWNGEAKRIPYSGGDLLSSISVAIPGTGISLGLPSRETGAIASCALGVEIPALGQYGVTRATSESSTSEFSGFTNSHVYIYNMQISTEAPWERVFSIGASGSSSSLTITGGYAIAAGANPWTTHKARSKVTAVTMYVLGGDFEIVEE